MSETIELPTSLVPRAVRIEEIGNHDALVRDDDRVAEIRERIQGGDVYIARRVVSRERLEPIRDYLRRVGRNSLPNYHPIRRGAPNSHRMNRWDPRSYVGGCFHQFSFFPWNQDPFDLFELFRSVYQVKNRLSALDGSRFLGTEPDAGCTARLSFQVYPRGGGALKLHADPVDHHQLVVPSLALSRRGEDFETGGVYIEPEPGRPVDLEGELDWGDVVYFNARQAHAVAPVDPDQPMDWLSFSGRWALVLAVNKLESNQEIANSKEFPSKEG
ncbi:MAG TPA: hypothetical protein RMG48_20895 [Myxococcales bacterium LLY-WYZ-16_1]|nr:hypothetical protein [Myxococcales bacterium LLY-WYZ-16_1]